MNTHESIKNAEENIGGVDYSLDNFRALAIILVVLGHSIIIYSSNWSLYTSVWSVPIFDKIKDIINLVQMQMFFSLSGYLYRGTLNKKKVSLIIKSKIYRILVPFLFFALGYLLPIRLLVKYPMYQNCSFIEIIMKKILLGYDNGHLWYLPTLFILFIVSTVIVKLQKIIISDEKIIYWLQLLMGICLYFLQMIVTIRFPYFQFASQYYIWFSFGMLIAWYRTNQNNNIYSKICRMKWLLICVCAVLVVLKFCIVNPKANLIVSNVASLLCLLTLYVCMPSKTTSVIQFISRNSFGIYLLHSPLVYITYAYFSDLHPLIVFVLNFVVFGGICLLISSALQNSRLKCLIGS